MTRISQIIASPRMQLVSGISLAALWLVFAVAHLTTFKLTGKVSLLTFALAETLIAGFFLLRPPPRTVTTNPPELAAAALGTFLPLLLRPTTDTPLPFSELGLMAGSGFLIAGVLSLNRSFALIPALRELKTEGMYRLVRHPIYLSYLITYSCYLTANFSVENLAIVCGSALLLLTRVHFEERHLAKTPEYRAYQARVRWRLIPLVF
ncbi:methyltransferase [Azoarcus sp. DN11]|uniref:methyltransferase family protein n=1 Tax=Azoarcus sp. DN11 TaxID=356837 RepID=UPI000EB1DEFF|nr:methyltransferase [Azoarcus sp. DN11]AYH45627.1 hypothetical protein CDA09_19955 [Azoarcus sp. DN11]